MQVLVMDSFEITNRLMPSTYPPGVVVVFDWREDDSLLPVVGEQVSLTYPSGQASNATVGEIKCHGPGRSFYFAGFTKAQAGIGSVIEWSPRRVGPRMQDDLGRLVVVRNTAAVAS